MLPFAEKVAAVTPDSPRALKADRLCEKLQEEYEYTKAVPYEQLGEAWHALRDHAEADDLICICGSLYMVGDIKALLQST